MRNNYTLKLSKDNTKASIAVRANDTAHAQAQAVDIFRSLEADKYDLAYEETQEDKISELFRRLAYNEFTNKQCVFWEGSSTNKSPCFYIFKKRFYIRKVVVKYLDISVDDLITKNTCNCSICVNPYHFEYKTNKNSKLTCGDKKLLLAYWRQGAGVSQIAKALNVHRSTIYRTLKDEHLCLGDSRHSKC